MEFETNKPSPDELVRLQASARRVTLQPVSNSVIPEAAAGAELSTKLSETANQPNVSTDSEDTSVQYGRQKTPTTVSNEHDHPKARVVIGSTVVTCLFAAAFIWMAIQ